MTYIKSINNKNCTFSEKNVPRILNFLSEPVLTEIFQNQMLKVKIWHF